ALERAINILRSGRCKEEERRGLYTLPILLVELGAHTVGRQPISDGPTFVAVLQLTHSAVVEIHHTLPCPSRRELRGTISDFSRDSLPHSLVVVPGPAHRPGQGRAKLLPSKARSFLEGRAKRGFALAAPRSSYVRRRSSSHSASGDHHASYQSSDHCSS